ncbi:MAG TPA: hypothetical protein VM582_05205 [Candidatus Thermoplasmatota archaeon]|nr:hypothetical protein [Candidatus Thermoplasmatota archaeon]
MPCGVPLAESVEAARRVAHELPSVPVLAFDASRYFARSGPSAAAAVEMLAHALHPEPAVSFGHASGWRRVR